MTDTARKQYDLIIETQGVRTKERHRLQKRWKMVSVLEYLTLFGNVGFSTSLPLVAGVIVGRVLDKSLHTSPVLTLLSLSLGMVISVVNLVRTIRLFLQKTKLS